MTAGKNKGITQLRYKAICGNIVYYDFIPEHILFDWGYVTFVNNQPAYHFYLADHQGNVRMVASANGTVEETNHCYPYGALFGESVSGSKQRYKYKGKELERLLALDWYDYGARWYDPVLARWHAVDPLADETPGVSPYVYCVNNAVNAVDPDGRKIVFVNGYLGFGSPEGGSAYWHGEHSTFVTNAQKVFDDYSVPFFTNYDCNYLESSNSFRDFSLNYHIGCSIN